MKIKILKWIVFFAAFLLFQIELIVAKLLLSQFGGGYSVWGAAIVFFQATLLLGYLYSHIVISKLGIVRYRYIHLGLLALTLFFFPGRSLPAMAPSPALPMVVNVFWQLLSTIGAAFFFLSTTSIIFQSLLASSELKEKSNPYTLYGISNLGSFAALLTYPFFFEPFFDLGIQLNTWRIVYIILGALNFVAFKVIKVASSPESREVWRPSTAKKDILRWFLFGAAGVIMFLSITNIITYEIIPMPLLWILPLSIYLLSFVLNFKEVPWCPSWITKKIHVVLALGVILYFLMEAKTVDFAIMLLIYLAVLFALCMFCQNKLYNSKPKDSRDLTLFYLAISMGGFVGGIVVSWVVPLISSSTIEYLAGLLVITAAMTIDQPKPLFYKRDMRRIILLLAVLIIWPLVFWGYNIFGLIIIGWIFIASYSRFRERPFMTSLSLLLILAMASSPITSVLWSKQGAIYRHRNYYGIYRIYKAQEKRYLTNGNTMHGAQYTIKQREMEPLTYYHWSTPMGRLLISPLFDFKNVAMIGLGAGTVAAYGKPGQTIDFFELDPDVYNVIATKYFTYLKNSLAKINVTLGDARITLRKAPENHYDILLIDAFSADYIPVHLLTTDAINEYKKHLTPKGIILFHTSNRYLALEPVLFADAKAVGAYACIAHNESSLDAAASEWIALTWDKEAFDLLTSQLSWHSAPQELPRFIRPWTDLYTNVTGVLRIGYLLNQIRTFQPFYWGFNILSDRNKNMYYYAAQGGRSLLDSDFNQSIDYYQKALELNPYDTNILRSLGNAYYLSGQYQQAISAYQRAVKISPNDADSLRNLGRVYTKQGSYQDAIESYTKATDVNPNDSEAFQELGSAYNSLGKYQEATRCYKRAVELNPNAFNMVLAYKFQQDVLRYQKDLEANPSDANALLSIGNAYSYLRQYKQAAESYEKLIGVNPNDTDTLEKLGDLYFGQGDYQKAIAAYLKVISIKPPGTAAILQKLGRTYAKQEDSSSALDYYNKALAIDSSNPFICMDIGAVYMKLRQDDKVVEYTLKAEKIFRDNNDLGRAKQLDAILNKYKSINNK